MEVVVPMIAAVYARKSTDQNLPDAEKSVTRTGAGHRMNSQHAHEDRIVERLASGALSPASARDPCLQAGP